MTLFMGIEVGLHHSVGSPRHNPSMMCKRSHVLVVRTILVALCGAYNNLRLCTLLLLS